MPNETIQREEEIKTVQNRFPRPTFVVLPKEEDLPIEQAPEANLPLTRGEEINQEEVEIKEEIKREEFILNEVKAEKIPSTAIKEINQAEIEMEEEKEEQMGKKEETEEIEQLELAPNGFSGMYILITILMITMIGISILGIILS